MWWTEFGYIVPEWTDANTAARNLTALFARVGDGVVDGAFWFALDDLSRTDAFGLVDIQGDRRPAFEAFAAAP